MALVRVNRSWYIRGFSLADPPIGSFLTALTFNSWTLGVHDHGPPGTMPHYDPTQLVDDAVYTVKTDEPTPSSVVVENPALTRKLPEGTLEEFISETGMDPRAWLKAWEAKMSPKVPEGVSEENVITVARALLLEIPKLSIPVEETKPKEDDDNKKDAPKLLN